MKIYAFHLLLVVLLAPLTVNAAPIQLSNNTRIEVVESLTTRELWNATKPNTVEAANAVVDFRMLDPEARPRNGKWLGCAVVMIGTGDLGIQPVTLRIWTMRPCELTVSADSKSRPEAEFTMRVDSKETLRIHVTRDLKVTVDGKAIGRIED